MPFVKSYFTHYCKNPIVYEKEHGGESTVITMEICQSPEHLKYIELRDKSKPQTPKEKKHVAINGEEDEERIEDDPYGDEGASASGNSYGGYGSYGSSGSGSDSYGEEESDSDEDDDREYNGDMFEHGSAELLI